MSTPARSRLRALTLLVTRDCNLSCAYCFVDRSAAETMPYEVMREAIDLLFSSSRGEQSILFSGGEPLLAFPRLRLAIEYARSRRPAGRSLQLHLTTNGTMMTPEIVGYLAEQDVEVQLSFDGGPSAPWARGAETFERLDPMLREIRRDHPHFFRRGLVVALNLTPQTIPFLAEAVDYLLAAGVARIRLGAIFPRNDEEQPTSIEDLEEQFARIHESSRRHYRATGRTPLSTLRPRDPARRDQPGPLTCQAGQGECLAVLPSGDASICSLFVAADLPDGPRSAPALPFRLGRIGTEEISRKMSALPAEAAQSVLFDVTEKRSVYGRCRDCEAAAACVVCPASVLRRADDQDWNRVPTLACALERVGHQARQRFQTEIGRSPGAGMAQILAAARAPSAGP